MKKSLEEREKRRINEIYKEYKNKGYQVIIDPSGKELPKFLHGYQPDIIARKDDDNVIIEVKTQESIDEEPNIKKLAELVENKPLWRFEFITTNPRSTTNFDPENKLLTKSDVEARLKEARKLMKINELDAAFILYWIALEGTLRHILLQEGKRIHQLQPKAVIKTAYSLGLFNRKEYNQLSNFYNHRNKIIHGYKDIPVKQNDLKKLNNLIEKLSNIE